MNILEIVKQALARSPMSDEEKRYVLASTWTMDEVPEIKSEEQYDAYAVALAEIERALGPWQTAEEFAAQKRSPQGMLATAIGARMIEWEELQEELEEARNS